jgi:hypothetical protein
VALDMDKDVLEVPDRRGRLIALQWHAHQHFDVILHRVDHVMLESFAHFPWRAPE